eukprot:scaffold271595_cov55-Prasinocladus_malaysianus.AAC.2
MPWGQPAAYDSGKSHAEYIMADPQFTRLHCRKKTEGMINQNQKYDVLIDEMLADKAIPTDHNYEILYPNADKSQESKLGVNLSVHDAPIGSHCWDEASRKFKPTVARGPTCQVEVRNREGSREPLALYDAPQTAAWL